MKEKIYKIAKFEKHDNGEYYFSEEKTTDSPYWKVIDGVVFYVFGVGKYGVDYSEKLHKMPMSAQEAEKNNCNCYYSII